MLRFKRRIGPSFYAHASRSQRIPLGRHSPDSAKPIGRRFTVFFATAVIHPLMHRTLSKVFLLTCLNKTH